MKKNVFILIFIIVNIVSALTLERFVRDNSKEVVIDTKTNLMWEDDSNVSTVTRTWQDAIDYCENLTLGGYTDWYLPNYNQLFGLADRSRYNPAISPVFQNIVNYGYWSSTTNAGQTTTAKAVNFSTGADVFWPNKSDSSFNVRCVRNNDS